MSCSSATATRLGVGHAVHFAGSARTFPAAVLRARACIGASDTSASERSGMWNGRGEEWHYAFEGEETDAGAI